MGNRCESVIAMPESRETLPQSQVVFMLLAM